MEIGDSEVIYAVPVKYMILKGWIGYKIVDTTFEGQGESVYRCLHFRMAHLMCHLLNKAEGYEYPL